MSRILFHTIVFFCLPIACFAGSLYHDRQAKAGDIESWLEVGNITGKTVFELPLQDRQCFAIRFLHSVARTPVYEWFCNQDGTLFLEKTNYQDFGAGLPYEAEPGQKMQVLDGQIEISGIHRQMQKFEIRVGRIANHTIIIQKEGKVTAEKALDSLAEPGSSLTFMLVKRQNRKSDQSKQEKGKQDESQGKNENH